MELYHLGKEQPKLKGTLPPTKVTPPKKKKTKRRTQQEILFSGDPPEKNFCEETKRFLNHQFGKNEETKKDFLNHQFEISND